MFHWLFRRAVCLVFVVPALAAIPPGSYQKSCTDISMDGTALKAKCTDFFGAPRDTSLAEADKCSNIQNVSGVLRCVVSSRQVKVHGSLTEFDIVTASEVKDASKPTKIWRIDQPDPTRISTGYPEIKFHPGDKISISANGCVQTGGSGATWKRYVDPDGSNSAAMYFGQLSIPGVTGGLQPIGASINNSPLLAPADLKSTVRTELSLWLGYMDDNRSDNGYWSHDDGTGDQCKNVGPAWVEVRVESDPVVEARGVMLSPHQKPFDLVWDMNNTDYNGLPWNPKWTAQLNSGPTESQPSKAIETPSFANTCQSAFSMGGLPFTKGQNYSGNPDTIDESKLQAICTTQAPYTDLRGYSAFDVSGLCDSDLLHGHLDWMIATYTGQVTWDHFSGHWPHDRDYNMNLFRADRAGLTADNEENDDLTGLKNYYLGMEFDAGETVDYFTSSWWKQLSGFEPYLSPADGSMNPDQDPAAEKFMGGSKGLFGVVTGLIGLDAIHGAPTESHPVFSIALLTDEQGVPGQTKVDETWAFFLRNSGDEGECSQLMHYWDGMGGTYYVQFPWPAGATGVEVMAHAITPWQKKGVSVDGFEHDPQNGMTLLKVRMPGDGSYGLDGQIMLRYTLKAPWHSDRELMGSAKPKKEEPEVGLADVSQRIADPAVKQRFESELQALEPAAHRVEARSPVEVSPAVALHKTVPGPASRGEITRSRRVADPARAKLQADTNAVLVKYKDALRKPVAAK